MNSRTKSRFVLALVTGSVLAMVLLLTPSLSPATETVEKNTHWSKWKALDKGYLARRKVPAKMDQPVTQRRLKRVQERLQKVQRLQKRLLKKQANHRDIAGLDRRLAKLDRRINRLASRANRLSRRNRARTLWFRTTMAGLHGVSVNDLADELGRRPEQVRRLATHGRLTLTNRGNPVSWYFDESADMILFAAQIYDSFYTDENAYRFQLGGKHNNQPMAETGNDPTAFTGDETPFLDTLTFEEEPDMNFSTWAVKSEPDADYWFWDYLYGGYKDSIKVNLAVPHPADSGPARLRIRLRGWTDLEAGDEHQVFAELNGIPVGSPLVWDGFEEAVLVADFDQNLLDPSGDNTLILRNIYSPGTHPGQFLDDIELDYNRLPVAVNNQLWLHDTAEGVQTVTGFTHDDIMVIESPAGRAVIRNDARIEPDGTGGYSVTFESGGNTDFLVADKDAMASPTVELYHRSRLRNRRNMADYLIIAPRDFTGTAEALASVRRNTFGRVKIAWLEDIYNDFGYGLEEPSAITRFMRFVHRAWRVSPTVVVLIGKGSLDHKDRMGYGDSFLPTLMTDTPWALAASDDRLLGGNGDAPYVIGRLPITNDDEGIAYVEKLAAYESTPFGDERYQALLVADNPDDGGDFHANADALADRLTNSLGFDWAAKLYHPLDAVRETFIQSGTWEVGYVSYDGHGSHGQIGDGSERFLTAADADALQNTTLPVFTALTCAAGDFTQPGSRSLAGALVLNPSGGAIVSLAPTGLSLDTDVQVLDNAFVDALFHGYAIGDAIQHAKAQTQGEIGGFMQRIYSVVGEPLVNAR
ncbi:MAG: hypothetical protein DSY89_05765 [Deltaproteobacteria bacterium]|nr:MAG: hypothetical protein DSY89_05765 [Deltaproteobacteria bacterium]